MTQPLPNPDPARNAAASVAPDEVSPLAGPAGADSTIIARSSAASAPETRQGAPAALAVVAAYAGEAEEERAGSGSTTGRLYALGAVDVLFVGRIRPPERLVLRDGKQLHLRFFHLFGREFELVSRRHLAIEMRPDGAAVLYEFSGNGTYLVGAMKHVIRAEEMEYESVVLREREILVLGADRADAVSTAIRPQLELVFLDRGAAGERSAASHAM